MSALRRVGRVLLWLGAAVVLLVAAAAGWALFRTYYNPRVPLLEPVIASRTPRGDEITLVMGGDFAPADKAMRVIDDHGYQYPYQATADLLRDADIAFANLEAPITDSDDRFPLPKQYIYKVAPEATEAWRWLGLDLVSLANNHIVDYRDRGIRDSVRHLDAAGILHAGAGENESEARRPVIFDVGGTRIGFLAYLEDTPAYNLYMRTFAVGGRVGCARLIERDVAEDVARLRPLVDILVVSVHWGKNYKPPTASQRRWAKRFASLGVDIVAGHHPHDVQPVEVIGKTVVIYSLGNYAWGAPGWPHLRIGFLARARIAPRRGLTPGQLVGVELVPIATQNRMVNFQPRPLRAGEEEWLAPFLSAAGDAVSWDGKLVQVKLNRD